jgi:hypothetical protein
MAMVIGMSDSAFLAGEHNTSHHKPKYALCDQIIWKFMNRKRAKPLFEPPTKSKHALPGIKLRGRRQRFVGSVFQPQNSPGGAATRTAAALLPLAQGSLLPPPSLDTFAALRPPSTINNQQSTINNQQLAVSG